MIEWEGESSSSISVYFLERILEEVVDDLGNNTTAASAHYNNDEMMSFSLSQQQAISVTERVAGFLSVVGGIHIFWNAWKRKDQVFHRLMLGLSIQTILWGILNIWGAAAIPNGDDTYGAAGNATTCRIQGFLFQTTLVVNFYYAALSCYSWIVIVLHIHDGACRYGYIEKYVHFVVHIFPIGSAIYLYCIDSFHSVGSKCWIASVPRGCGGDSGVECEDGPKNPQKIMWIFGGIPAIFLVIFPTIVMTALVVTVKMNHPKPVPPQHQPSESIPPQSTHTLQLQQEKQYSFAHAVAKQSAVYLGALYWIYLPFLTNLFSPTKEFCLAMWCASIFSAQGLWFAMVYWYFTAEGGKDDAAMSFPHDYSGQLVNNNATRPRSSLEDKGSTIEFADSDLLAAQQSLGRSEGCKDQTSTPFSMKSSNRSNTSSGFFSIKSPASQHKKKKLSPRPSFNIFDGKGANGRFSDFIFDGDSDDEENDAAESMHWAGCQNVNTSSGLQLSSVFLDDKDADDP